MDQRASTNPSQTTHRFREPRFAVAEYHLSAGFWANLKDFLTERPVKLPRGARGSFGSLDYGSGLFDNLKDFFRPLPPEARRAVNTRLEVNLKPWYVTLAENLRDLLFPRKLPPLKVTSQPVQVRDIWSRDENFKRTQALSLVLHAALITIIALPIFHDVAFPKAQAGKPEILTIDLSPYLAQLPPGEDKAGGGGGGGERNPTPATKGRLPRFAMQQLSPPALARNPDPKLAVEPTVVVPPDIRVPNPALPTYGDPLAAMITDSQGPGSGGGFGTGSGGGVGSGSGPGVGPGWGGGIGGGAFRPGTGGVGYPACLYCPDPQFSEEARKAKHQGVVVLRVLVTAEGRPAQISVVKGLGLGLDEKAVEAVQNWRFKPATGPGGKPVPVWVPVEVVFRLL